MTVCAQGTIEKDNMIIQPNSRIQSPQANWPLVPGVYETDARGERGHNVFDRLLREMLSATLPARTIDTVDVLPLPLSPRDRHATIRLKRPDGREETLTVEALGGDAYGVTLRDLVERGLYTVTATKGDPAGGGAEADRPSRAAAEWQLAIAAGCTRKKQSTDIQVDDFFLRVWDQRIGCLLDAIVKESIRAGTRIINWESRRIFLNNFGIHLKEFVDLIERNDQTLS